MAEDLVRAPPANNMHQEREIIDDVLKGVDLDQAKKIAKDKKKLQEYLTKVSCNFCLRDYCHTIALWAQFANNKSNICESLLILLIVTDMEANKDSLTLFLIFDKIKQNVNNKNPRNTMV